MTPDQSKPQDTTKMTFKQVRHLKRQAEAMRVAQVKKKYKRLENIRHQEEQARLRKERADLKANTPVKLKVSLPTTGKSKPLKSKKKYRKQYLKYIEGPIWRKLRNQILDECGCICTKCNKEFERPMLHVHHMTYKRLFNEEKTDLMVLCKFCHKAVHRMPRLNNPYFI